MSAQGGSEPEGLPGEAVYPSPGRPGAPLHPMAGLPAKVEVWEVGPRDGLQNETSVVPTAVKTEFVERLVSAGLRTVEVTSFVSARWVPQLADAAELLAALPRRQGVRFPVLVPNLAGLERALASGARDVAVFASATESFSRRNLNRSVDESIAMFSRVVERARAEGLAVRGYLSMCFADPWEGPVPPARTAAVARRLVDIGCDQVSVGDTIGVATPGQVWEVIDAMGERGIAPGDLAVHFHDTYGQALANTLAAMQRGVATVDSSAGGIGGCPFAHSATGNLATEDLVWQLHGLGIDTGIDLAALAGTSAWMAERLGRRSVSKVVRALSAGGSGAKEQLSR